MAKKRVSHQRIDKHCEYRHCGKSFVASRRDARFCCDAHKTAEYRCRKAETVNQETSQYGTTPFNFTPDMAVQMAMIMGPIMGQEIAHALGQLLQQGSFMTVAQTKFVPSAPPLPQPLIPEPVIEKKRSTATSANLHQNAEESLFDLMRKVKVVSDG